MISIEIFSSPGCGKCVQAKAVLKEVVEVFSDKVTWREVSILDEMDYAIDLGIMASPAIVINGELIFTSLPSASKLSAEILRRL